MHCPNETVVAPVRTVYENVYHPQLINVVHPIEIVRRHICVPVYRHVAAYNVRDEYCNVSSHQTKRKKR